MYALLMSAALLGELNPLVRDMLLESDRRRTEQKIQEREAAVQQSIAVSNRDEERKNTYIIAGAVVAGLVLLGLLSRSGKATSR